jgi:uncharacterized membrane protein YkvA (DUF1232 family)
LGFIAMKENGITYAWRFLTDRKAGRWQKFFLLLAFIYVVWPLDFVPDVAIVIGWIDDAVALLAGVSTFMVALRKYRIQQSASTPIVPAQGQVIETVGTEVS